MQGVFMIILVYLSLLMSHVIFILRNELTQQVGQAWAHVDGAFKAQLLFIRNEGKCCDTTLYIYVDILKNNKKKSGQSGLAITLSPSEPGPQEI